MVTDSGCWLLGGSGNIVTLLIFSGSLDEAVRGKIKQDKGNVDILWLSGQAVSQNVSHVELCPQCR